MHLMGGEIDLEALEEQAAAEASRPVATSSLSEEITDMKSRLAALEDAFERFRAQFE